MILVLLAGALLLVLLVAGWRWALVFVGATILVVAVNVQWVTRPVRLRAHDLAMRADLQNLVTVQERERAEGRGLLALPDSTRYRNSPGVVIVSLVPTVDGFIAQAEHRGWKGRQCQTRHRWRAPFDYACYDLR